MEEPGAWGSEAVPSSRLGPATTAALAAAARASGSKLLLVRRPVRRGADSGRRRLFRAVCRRGAEQVLTKECAVEELPGAAVDDDGWEPADGPLLLVCTHGRKDWCCAVRGRPLAAALGALEPDGTWECSHLGGCRFAANLLVLPSGLTYGQVDAGAADEVVAAVREGRVLTRSLRGRTSDAMVVQAADAHARAALGRHDADDLVPSRAERLDEAGDAWSITLDGAPGRPTVVVGLEQRHVAVPQRLTCSAPGEQYARTWALTGLRERQDSAPAEPPEQ